MQLLTALYSLAVLLLFGFLSSYNRTHESHAEQPDMGSNEPLKASAPSTATPAAEEAASEAAPGTPAALGALAAAHATALGPDASRHLTVSTGRQPRGKRFAYVTLLTK